METKKEARVVPRREMRLIYLETEMVGRGSTKAMTTDVALVFQVDVRGR